MFGRRSKNQRWADEMTRQQKDRAFIESEPLAMQLTVVHNEGSGWKWLCFTYDPDGARIVAGAVEGILVPHGLKGGYGTRDEALIEGILAIRKGGWDGDIVLREKDPAHA